MRYPSPTARSQTTTPNDNPADCGDVRGDNPPPRIHLSLHHPSPTNSTQTFPSSTHVTHCPNLRHPRTSSTPTYYPTSLPYIPCTIPTSPFLHSYYPPTPWPHTPSLPLQTYLQTTVHSPLPRAVSPPCPPAPETCPAASPPAVAKSPLTSSTSPTPQLSAPPRCHPTSAARPPR